MIGVHINSYIDYIVPSVKYVYENKGKVVQLFVDSNNYQNKHYKKVYSEFKKYTTKNNILCVVHASYSINIAKKWDEYSSWVQQIITEIIMAHNIGAFGIVIHIGKQMDLSQNEAYNNMYSYLVHIHRRTEKYEDVKILLETSTGQGSELCYKIEDLAYFYKKISKNANKKITERFGICLDTCHIFAAGYDLKTKSSIHMYLEAFEELIGLRHIKLIHLNDSKKDVGSNVDRHDNIGHGKIGSENLLYIAKYFSNQKVPIVLETPGDNMLDDLLLLQTNN